MLKNKIAKKVIVEKNTEGFEKENLELEKEVILKPQKKVVMKPKPVMQPKPVIRSQPQTEGFEKKSLEPKKEVILKPQEKVVIKSKPVMQPKPVIRLQPKKVIKKIQPKPVAPGGKILSAEDLKKREIKKKKKAQEFKLFVSESLKLKQELNGLAKLTSINAPIIRIVDYLIRYSFLIRASDIHFEPFDDKMIVRLRIDGILQDSFAFHKDIQAGLITRIKVLAGMRTDEHRAAQDGRFRIEITTPIERSFDIRVSVVPTYYGEKAVLRLLAEQEEIESLDDLAFTPENRAKIERAIKKPYGMILATGPTGCGKTTTLYTSLKAINSRGVCIITIEDPIEYSIEGVDQIQVNNQTGLTFANGLRSILRQDPDAIMVGEIRDQETASIAINAALTGHKMFSTLHTNDAATTLPRLLDMKVEPFLIASTVNIAIGQRLLRTICPNCRNKKILTDIEFRGLREVVPATILKQYREFYFGKGCSSCNGTGYKGRVGIYEIMEIDDDIRAAIVRRVNSGEIKKIAMRKGMKTMMEDAFQKALNGIITIEEVLKMTHED